MLGIYGDQLVVLYFAMGTMAMFVIVTVLDVFYGWWINRK